MNKKDIKRHLTLKEIGIEGQLKLKNSSVFVLEQEVWLLCVALSCCSRNWKNWNS